MRKVREGRGEVHAYLTDGELSRAAIAKWWGTTPFALARIPKRELRIMGEFLVRTEKAREEAIEAAKLGLPTPGRTPARRPKPGDEIVTPTRDNPSGARW